MKIVPTRSFVVAAGVALSMTACAGMPRESEGARLARYLSVAGKPVSNVAYNSGSASGFSVVDGQHVLLTTRPTVAFLLKLSGPCLDYDAGSPALTVTSSMGRIQSRFDRIGTLREPRFTCLIQEIRPIDVKALREAEKSASSPG